MTTKGLIIVSGATGFIGRALCRHLGEQGYDVAVLSRDRNKAKAAFGDAVIVAEWDGQTSRGWVELASRSAAVVNLAGENIGSGRWTKTKRERILSSRLAAGKSIVEAVQKASPRPRTLVQASAVGYYGPIRDEILDESACSGDGFLADVVRRWEHSTAGVEELGVRRVIIRSGLVLGRGGGVLPRFLAPFRFFVGGPLGSGNQGFTWIHERDEIRAIQFLLEREDLGGVFNFAAPEPLTNKEFSRTLGQVMGRPSWFPVPAFLLRLLFGQMARETLLSGQKVRPRALLEAGFTFVYPDLEGALREVLSIR